MQCSHCVNTINSTLLKINGIYGVEANIANKQLVLDHTPEVDISEVNSELNGIGYPSTRFLDKFEEKASVWDNNLTRRIMAEKFVRRVMENIPILPEMTLMDFGCGTGLVGLQFAPYVKSLLMADSSAAMLGVLKDKVKKLELDTEKMKYFFPDIKSVPANSVDVIVSSMTLHHIADTKSIFTELHTKLKPGGYLAVADLVTESGSFHKEPVPHNGFDQHDLCEQLSQTGFQLSVCEIFNRINKETAKNKTEEFPQFIIIAKK